MRVERCSFLKFALKSGIKAHKKETLRIFLRMLMEFSRQIVFVAYNEDNAITAFTAARRLPSKYKFDRHDIKDNYIVGPIQVMPEYRKCGVGAMLLGELTGCIIKKCQEVCIYAYIRTENIASQKLFEKCGFEKIGYMEKIKNRYCLTQKESRFFVYKNTIIGREN